MAGALVSAVVAVSTDVAVTTLDIAFPTWLSADRPDLGSPRLL